MKTVLVSGASVAGLTLAYWLRRNGFAPTVVERAPSVRPGGQAIDVRGAALDVLDRTGILDDARGVRTRLRGMAMLDGEGNEQWRSTEKTFSGGRLDSADIELLREDLTGLLYERALAEGVEFLFGDSIAALDEAPHGAHAQDAQHPQHIRVGFEQSSTRTFDLVVGADGLHSKVRQLAFGPEHAFIRHLGAYLTVFSTENFLELDNWELWLNADSVSYCLYPVRDNSELRATLGFTSEPIAYDHRDTEAQKALMADRLAHVGWETPRLLKAMREAPDFYFDAMAQIHMDHWSRGRVALVGDAGYCASPLSGQGTSLALVGAYVLADELGKAGGGDHTAAFARYEARMRPFVELNQALVGENAGGMPSDESMDRAKNGISLDEPDSGDRAPHPATTN
ncbi:FAD-dependent monooxygenase [Streptomyces sp. XD-27]|uniref:FAD-dependent monooxygenase n=1 Tax=Streptomyces sp. XD-27 TaxID=3062779 RepID=UPI0026F45B30|nr:FAD-dependent monooxygenase [Streptomyces sp. XD-27]WKX71340.1 FAD-dependent monooxygenase [Streptomyces sp. XD-27]